MDNSASTTVNYRARQGLLFQQYRRGLLTRAELDAQLALIYAEELGSRAGR